MEWQWRSSELDLKGAETHLLLLIEVREDGKSSFAPELGAADDDGLAGRDGNVQVSGVGLAHLKKTANTNYSIDTQ